jgi:two-component system response regulator DegU
MSPMKKGKTKTLPIHKSANIRVIIIDDNELLRTGIKALMAGEKGFEVVGEARTLAQATSLIMHQHPDVILLNDELKKEDALGMIPNLLAACKKSRLAVLTASTDPEFHRQALARGAIGLISKGETPGSLMLAIRQVHSGGVWLDRFIAAKMIQGLSSGDRKHNRSNEGDKIASLTKRECEVVRLVGEGLKNKRIADRLFISPVTVHHHLTTIYSKLDVKDRLELIVYAYKNGLAEVPH